MADVDPTQDPSQPPADVPLDENGNPIVEAEPIPSNIDEEMKLSM